MRTSWTKMRESFRGNGDSRVNGFTYECADGHEWFVPLVAWSDRGANLCSECETLSQVQNLETEGGV